MPRDAVNRADGATPTTPKPFMLATINPIVDVPWRSSKLIGFAAVAVWTLVAVLWLTDWSNPTHRLIFAATMLVWINLALWVYTLVVRNRVGEQRILRAIDVLFDSKTEESS